MTKARQIWFCWTSLRPLTRSPTSDYYSKLRAVVLQALSLLGLKTFCKAVPEKWYLKASQVYGLQSPQACLRAVFWAYCCSYSTSRSIWLCNILHCKTVCRWHSCITLHYITWQCWCPPVWNRCSAAVTDKWLMQFNPSKCQLLRITLKRKPVEGSVLHGFQISWKILK